MKNKLLGSLILAVLCFFQTYAQEQKSFSTQKGKKLDLVSRVGGNVIIKGWDKMEVDVSIDHNFDESDVTFTITESNGNVTVKGEKNGGGNNWGWGNKRTTYEVYVPNEFDLELKTSGGNLDIDGVNGEIEGRTSGGNVDVSNLAGQLKLGTSGGNIGVNNVTGDGRVSTSGGNVTVKSMNGKFDLSTSGGNITISDSEIEGKASTSGGGINVSRTKGALSVATSGGNISFNDSETSGTARTSGGNIKVDQANEGSNVSTSGGNITINSARKFAIAKTSGGNITIKEIDGKVEAKTSGGNIDVKMRNSYDGAHDAELVTSGGEVTLYVPANMGMDFDVTLEITKNSNKDYKINSDFPMNVSEGEMETSENSRYSRKKITGTGSVGNGKNRIMIKTVNGDINIKKI